MVLQQLLEGASDTDGSPTRQRDRAHPRNRGSKPALGLSPKGTIWLAVSVMVMGVIALVHSIITTNTMQSLLQQGVRATADVLSVEEELGHFRVTLSYDAEGRSYTQQLPVTSEFARTVSRDYGAYGGLKPIAKPCTVLYDRSKPERAVVAGGAHDEGPMYLFVGLGLLAVGVVLFAVGVIRRNTAMPRGGGVP